MTEEEAAKVMTDAQIILYRVMALLENARDSVKEGTTNYMNLRDACDSVNEAIADLT